MFVYKMHLLFLAVKLAEIVSMISFVTAKIMRYSKEQMKLFPNMICGSSILPLYVEEPLINISLVTTSSTSYVTVTVSYVHIGACSVHTTQ